MMRRRDFVNSGVCAVAAGSLLANENNTIITDAIDAHVHVWDKSSDSYPMAAGFSEANRVPATFTPDELFAQCRPQGVTQIVPLSPTLNLTEGRKNTFLARPSGATHGKKK